MVRRRLPRCGVIRQTPGPGHHLTRPTRCCACGGRPWIVGLDAGASPVSWPRRPTAVGELEAAASQRARTSAAAPGRSHHMPAAVHARQGAQGSRLRRPDRRACGCGSRRHPRPALRSVSCSAASSEADWRVWTACQTAPRPCLGWSRGQVLDAGRRKRSCAVSVLRTAPSSQGQGRSATTKVSSRPGCRLQPRESPSSSSPLPTSLTPGPGTLQAILYRFQHSPSPYHRCR